MSGVKLTYSHLGIGSAPICGCHDQSGGIIRAYNEPIAVIGTTGIGGSSSLFYPTGQGKWILDLGRVPLATRGVVRISEVVPVGTTATFSLKASNTGAFAGEEVVIGSVSDGSIITTSYRYFELTMNLTSNTNRDSSPMIDMFMVVYPRGYPVTGSCRLLLDVQFTPEQNGSWEIDSIIPSGSSLVLNATASNQIDSGGNLIGDVQAIGAITHGQSITVRKRYYNIDVSFQSTPSLNDTPRLRRIKANFPNG